jgi:hypothetical protein
MTTQGGTAVILAMLALIGVGCGGGDDGGGGVITTQLTATFAATDSSPDPQSITMQPAGGSAAVFNVAIRVTDVNDFFGAAFHVTFDTTKVRFDLLDSSTSFLRDGGIDPADLNFTYLTQSGNIAITATRMQNASGTVTGVDVPPTGRDLLILHFHAIATTTASSPISFADPREVCDSSQPVCTPITVTWSGGSVVVH